ncbi:MAG TPA: hypothetical protein VN776_15290 [Terracidiphilus sp.]|nr:hypothetical protein [Terracidiphilus sp.]
MADKHSLPPFDVRDRVPESELDDESIQLIYDAINRMVVLIGEIALARLFLAPLSELCPLIEPRVEMAAQFGLLREEAAVTKLIRELRDQAGEATIASFFVRSRDRIAPETSLLLRKLRRHGVRIPLPVSDGSEQEARQGVIDELIRVFPEGSFRALFDPKPNQLTPEVRKAIQHARYMGLFSWWVNDKCCRCEMSGGVPNLPTDCNCYPSTGKWCAIDDQGMCLGDMCPDT